MKGNTKMFHLIGISLLVLHMYTNKFQTIFFLRYYEINIVFERNKLFSYQLQIINKKIKNYCWEKLNFFYVQYIVNYHLTLKLGSIFNILYNT